MSLANHLVIILDKTRALRLRLNQIDTLVGVTDTQIKESGLTPQEMETLDENFDGIETSLDGCELNDSISNIETVLGI